MKKSIYFAVLFIFSTLISQAQTIPNNGFENWMSMGSYNNPDAWSCLNDMTTSMSVYTCVKGTPGVTGTGYLKLTSKSVSGMGIMPGVAVCGILDALTLQPTSGFAFTDRPQSFIGDWQYMAFGSDQGFISVLLTKWNNAMMMRDTVAMAYEALVGMAMSWVNFSIPFTYMNGDYPDSCIIVLSASGANNASPAVNSYLYVDNLDFTGTVAGVNENLSNESVSLSPNPAIDILTLNVSSLKIKTASAKVYDAMGRIVKSFEEVNVNENTSLNVSDLPGGNYILKLYTPKESITRNFIKR